MSTQLLIYKSAVPISRTQHVNASVETVSNYEFSRGINAVPLMAVEFPQAANEYPIVFSGTEAEPTPAVILGVRDGENLFVTPNHGWDAKYIPAFLRRYPFVFSQMEEKFILCVDEGFQGFNREGRGEKLITPEGTPSPYVDNVLKFLQEFQAQHLNTQRFCNRIKSLGLLDPQQIQVTSKTGQSSSLGGFMAVNRERLKALPAATLAELAKTDELELIYTHLHSMRNFDNLRDKLDHQLTVPAMATTH